MNNLSDETLTYTLTSSSLTEGIVTQDGVKFSDQVSTRLEEDDFTVSYSGSTVEDGVVTVPANGTATVDVTIQLSDSYLSELRENFENGNFCEGYIYLQPTDGVELVIPYLGFVGDWVTAGTTFEGDPGSDYSLAPTNFATVNLTGAGLFLGEDAVYTGPKSYNYDRLAFSPKIAGEQQFLAMQLGIRRNVMDFEVSISDEEGNKVWSLGADYLRKCYYNTNTGSVSQAQVLTDGWNGRYQDPETGEYTGDYAPAGQYYLTLEGYAEPLMGLFLQPEETAVLAAGVRYLRIEGAFYPGIACLFLLYGIYRAVRRPGMSVVLTVLSLGTRVALAYALAGPVGESGIWWAIPIGWFLADAVGLGYYFRHRRTLLPDRRSEE